MLLLDFSPLNSITARMNLPKYIKQFDDFVSETQVSTMKCVDKNQFFLYRNDNFG